MNGWIFYYCFVQKPAILSMYFSVSLKDGLTLNHLLFVPHFIDLYRFEDCIDMNYVVTLHKLSVTVEHCIHILSHIYIIVVKQENANRGVESYYLGFVFLLLNSVNLVLYTCSLSRC